MLLAAELAVEVEVENHFGLVATLRQGETTARLGRNLSRRVGSYKGHFHQSGRRCLSLFSVRPATGKKYLLFAK